MDHSDDAPSVRRRGRRSALPLTFLVATAALTFAAVGAVAATRNPTSTTGSTAASVRTLLDAQSVPEGLIAIPSDSSPAVASAGTSSPAATAGTAVKSVVMPRVATPGVNVGPLFGPSMTGAHFCTASVVDSPAGDVLVTAAHCASGAAAGLVFAPGYVNGQAPSGTWIVTAAYVDQAWKTSQDPAADYTFLTVIPASSNATAAAVQTVVGAAKVTLQPVPGQRVTVTGYAHGVGGSPLSCTTTVRYTESDPTFDCNGFVDGTSGSPWTSSATNTPVGSTVSGVIGGLNQGGCTPDISYSAPFTTSTLTVLHRASTGATPDILPTPGDDQC
jgi:hypothetical protein